MITRFPCVPEGTAELRGNPFRRKEYIMNTRPMTQRRRQSLILLIAALAGAVAAIWFYLPKTVCKTIPLCSKSGETAEIQLDVTWRRRLLRPNRLYGCVTFQGQTFYSRYGYELLNGNLLEIPVELSFANGLRQKFSGEPTEFCFLLLDADGAFQAQSAETSVWIESLSGESFRRIRVSAPGTDGREVQFFGPSESVEQASAIARAFR